MGVSFGYLGIFGIFGKILFCGEIWGIFGVCGKFWIFLMSGGIFGGLCHFERSEKSIEFKIRFKFKMKNPRFKYVNSHFKFVDTSLRSV